MVAPPLLLPAIVDEAIESVPLLVSAKAAEEEEMANVAALVVDVEVTGGAEVPVGVTGELALGARSGDVLGLGPVSEFMLDTLFVEWWPCGAL
jgi:hypothetical protein